MLPEYSSTLPPVLHSFFFPSLFKSLNLSSNSRNRSTQMRNPLSCHQIIQQPTCISGAFTSAPAALEDASCLCLNQPFHLSFRSQLPFHFSRTSFLQLPHSPSLASLCSRLISITDKHVFIASIKNTSLIPWVSPSITHFLLML